MESPKLVIELQSNGSVTVSGPLGNKFLCYGMLEAAKDAVRDYVQKNQSAIVPVSAALPNIKGVGN